MDQRSGPTHVDAVTMCTEMLRDLEIELQAAANAIACNKLTNFEESLWRQEFLCAKLRRVITTIGVAVSGSTSPVVLREPASRLKAQCQVYEKLVSQSKRSTAILQHLCSLYRNAARSPAKKLHTAITCEA